MALPGTQSMQGRIEMRSIVWHEERIFLRAGSNVKDSLQGEIIIKQSNERMDGY